MGSTSSKKNCRSQKADAGLEETGKGLSKAVAQQGSEIKPGYKRVPKAVKDDQLCNTGLTRTADPGSSGEPEDVFFTGTGWCL